MGAAITAAPSFSSQVKLILLLWSVYSGFSTSNPRENTKRSDWHSSHSVQGGDMMMNKNARSADLSVKVGRRKAISPSFAFFALTWWLRRGQRRTEWKRKSPWNPFAACSRPQEIFSSTLAHSSESKLESPTWAVDNVWKCFVHPAQDLI